MKINESTADVFIMWLDNKQKNAYQQKGGKHRQQGVTTRIVFAQQPQREPAQ